MKVHKFKKFGNIHQDKPQPDNTLTMCGRRLPIDQITFYWKTATCKGCTKIGNQR